MENFSKGKDMGGQISLSYHLTYFKARILYKFSELEIPYPRVFWSLIENLRSDLKNSKSPI